MHNQKNFKTSTALPLDNLSPLVLSVGSGNRYLPCTYTLGFSVDRITFDYLPCITHPIS